MNTALIVSPPLFLELNHVHCQSQYSPVFRMRLLGGVVNTELTVYTPVLCPMPDGPAIRLALHSIEAGGWALSDPLSGIRVMTVMGSYRGIRVSSRGMNLAEARQEARKQFVALVDAVGPDKVRKALADAAAQAQHNEQAALLAAAKAMSKLVVGHVGGAT